MTEHDRPADSPSAPPRKSHSSPVKKWVVGLLIMATAVALAVGIPLYLHYRHTHVSTDDAFVDGYVHYVTPRIPGKIAEILVDDNQPVEAGQVLVKLDPRDLEMDVRIARYKLAAAQNRISALVQSARAAKAQTAALEAQASYAAKQKRRVTLLARSDAVPEAQFDESYMRWQSVTEQVAAAERQRREILASLGPRDPHGEPADIELARAVLAKAELELGYTTIRAPVRGIVTRREVQVGQAVAPAQPLFAIVPLEDVFVTANYKETQLTHVRPGQAVTMRVDTYPDARLSGRVDSIMSGTGAAFSLIPPENATGNYVKVVQRIPVKIVLRHRDGDPILRVGMSVEPTILVDQP
jgi:membrane fusion protein (multidrug efflux system)